MPKEYYDYLFFIEDETVSGLKDTLKTVINLDSKELTKKGKMAREFAITEKNYRVMTKRIVQFLEKQKLYD